MADNRNRVSEHLESGSNSFRESLVLETQLGFVSAHSARGAAGEDECFTRFQDFHDLQDILYLDRLLERSL
jgi:hypothetical protein